MADQQTHFRKLVRMYEAAPINGFFAPKLSVRAGAAEVQLAVREAFFHSAGAMHGAVYFKALDDATFFAAQSLVDEFFVVTAHFELDLLKPVGGGIIRAAASVTKQSGRRVWAAGELLDEQGEVVARGEGVFVISSRKLTPDIHYR